MSKAVVFHEPGGPEVLRVVETEVPRVGPGQVLIEVMAAGVQPFDVAVVEGWLPAAVGPMDYPRIPGNEYAGVVREVGEGVSGFAAGDEVLGFNVLGSYREHAVFPADQITAKPANMPWEVAGGFTAAAQNAHIALQDMGLGAGETLLVHGAAGAVGTIAVQLARLKGATVIGAAREPQHDYLRSLGAVPVSYGDGFADRVRSLAPGGVVHGAIDGVGGHALDASLELIADRSRIFTLVEHGKAADLGVRTVPPKRSAARLAELADLYAQGRLQVHLHRTFPLEKAADAHRHYKAGGIRGKIVLTTDALHGAAGG
ncbi:quinone oxidoreductase family protein [Nocardiopsis composta]|uniref:NADPH:quinone reductase-like Zn-dependent oxidoreductase n=1 Tax=Nocardiopsis composta TaxID=157465 RepID=A0A7W8VF77_9ACTN|nr:NADP-dependent oxidoreductase [Nocardiopsis composta]MBB5433810.1 NADPH:quinone reductase-like Zn-dependent oxidoreductase [Nocardiopsis composta]